MSGVQAGRFTETLMRIWICQSLKERKGALRVNGKSGEKLQKVGSIFVKTIAQMILWVGKALSGTVKVVTKQLL